MSGLFGTIIGDLETAAGIGGPSPATAAAAATPGAGNLVSELINSAGGLSGIAARFGQAGLGDKVGSWMGSGGNIPLAAEEVLKVFPQDQLEALAEKHGVPAGMVAQVLAHLLPQTVDQATQAGAAATAGATMGSTDQGSF